MKTTSMNGKTVLVTGATNGIGKVTARELAKMGAAVVVVGRDRARTEETVREIKTASDNPAVDMLLADLSSLAEVRTLAGEFKAKYTRLDVLVNNAGGVFSTRQTTMDGFELTFALNHLNYFLLTHLLLDVIKASAPARIINVSSDAHRMGPMRLDDLQAEQAYGMGGFRAYSQSKLANVLFTYELARRLEGAGVTVNAVHPGPVATGFGRNNGGLFRVFITIFQRFALTPEQGADTSIYLASAPEVAGVTGKYFDRRKAVESSHESYDQEAQRKLWAASEQLCGLPVTA